MTGPFFISVLGAACAQPPDRMEVAVDLATVRPGRLRGPHIGFAEGGYGSVRHLSVDAEGLDQLRTLGLSWQPVPEPPDTIPAGYHTPDDMVAALDDLAVDFPDRVRRVDIGQSVEGRPIVALRLSSTDTPQGHIRILGAHHGDELVSAELALAVARLLAESERAIDLLPDQLAVWVVPHVNPDGVSTVTRHNARDVDLNRNYGYRWSMDEFRPGTGPMSEPETRAVEALTLRAPPVIGLSLHSGATNFGWVWNHTTAPTADEDRHTSIADAYARACTLDGFWVTNGAEWYPTNGDTNDWAYGYWGAFDYTVELSTTKTPAPELLPSYLDAHLDAVLAIIHQTPVSYGQIIDAHTGNPVRGTIQRALGGQPFRTTDDGRFGLVLSDPNTSVRVTASGYAPRTVPADRLAPVALTPTSGASEHEIWPPVVRLDDLEGLELSHRASVVSLSPPGRPPHWASPDGHLFSSLSTGLPPGAWSVEVDGAPTRYPLLVDAIDAPPIVSRTVESSVLFLEQTAGGVGRAAWIYQDSQLVRQTWLDGVEPQVSIDLSDLSSAARVDVALHGPGGMVWVADVFGGAWTAAHPPPGTGGLDTGLMSVRPGQTIGCGCSNSPATPPMILGWVLVGWLRRRNP